MPLLGRRSDGTARRRDSPPEEGEGTEQRGSTDVLGSPRLERLAAYFAAQLRLIEESRRQVEQEVEPLRQLLERQPRSISRLMADLDERLGPIHNYAANEEANLRALEEWVGGEELDFVARPFSELVEAQRLRVAETRSLMERQREPFAQFAADEREGVDLALEHLDPDVEALERSLTEQDAVLQRLLDALRSEDFKRVMDYLTARQQALEVAAEGGAADPAAIASGMRAVHGSRKMDEASNAPLGTVASHAASADERLASAGGPVGERIVNTPEAIEEAAEEAEIGAASPT